MPRFVAFLRAINVGGHNVRMGELRALFEGMKFGAVDTFIASGNVVFEADETDTTRLETMIEKRLAAALGYDVATFIRTPAELAAIAVYPPFPQPDLDAAQALNVAFLKAPLTDDQLSTLGTLTTDIDAFHTRGRELYWKCLLKQSQSTFSNAVLERKLKLQATFRGINTVRKMAAKWG